MINTTKNYRFLKTFINSEFFIQKDKVCLTSPTNHYQLKQNSLVILDPILHLKELKQFIRLLQFLKFTPDSKLHLVVKNSQYDFLIQEFLKRNNSLGFQIENSIDTDLKKVANYSRLSVLIDCFLHTDSNFFIKSNLSIYNLIYKINSNVENNVFENYKLYGKVDSIKKLFFILIVIKQIYKLRT